MKEQIHQSHGHESQTAAPIAARIRELSGGALRAAQDVLLFAFEPIVFEFHRMREEAEQCSRAIENSSLDETGKQRMREMLAQTLGWLESAEDLHFHHFANSKPVIETRHEMTRRLEEIRRQLSLAA